MENKRKVCSVFLLLLSSFSFAVSVGPIIAVEDELLTVQNHFCEMIDRYFPQIQQTTVVSNNNTRSVAETFIRKYRSQTSVMHISWDSPHRFPEFMDYSLLIFFLDDPKQINKTLSVEKPFWKHKTKIVVVVFDGEVYEDPEQQRSLFQVFWTRRIINVLLFVPHQEKLLVYGYTPYSRDSCNEPLPILLTERDTKGWVRFQNNFSSNKYFINLNGCQVNLTYRVVSPFTIDKYKLADSRNHVKGIEGQLMQVASEKLNFTPNYKFTNLMEFAEFSHRGLLGQVYFGISDIGFGLVFGFASRYDYFDIGVPHNIDECVGFAVPKGAGSTHPKWIKLFVMEFTYTVWILIGCSFFLGFVYFAIPYFQFLNSNKANMSVFRDLFPSFLGLPLLGCDETQFRSFAIAWIWYSYIVTTAYRSAMSSRLTAPNPPTDIHTLLELSQSDLHITGPYNAYQLLTLGAEGEIGNIRKTLLKRYEVLNEFTIEDIMERMADKRDNAFVRFCKNFQYLASLNEKARGKIHIVGECLYPYIPWVLIRKGCPLSKPLGKVIYALSEGGILKQWHDELLPQITVTEKDSIRELRLDDIAAIFWFLGLGLTLSTVVFFFELLLAKTYKKCRSEQVQPLSAPLIQDHAVIRYIHETRKKSYCGIKCGICKTCCRANQLVLYV